MQAIRQIISVQNNSLNIVLPNDFKAEMVEVIVLPMDAKETPCKNSKLRGKLRLTDDQYKNFHEDIKKSRS